MDSFNNNDPFKQFVKSKLADYKKDVPPSGWENLESSLFAAQKVKVVHTRWIVTTLTAVAAALFGVFFVFQNMNRELPTHTADIQTTVPSANQSTPQSTTNNEAGEAQITKQNSHRIEKSTPALYADNTSSIKQKVIETETTNRNQETSLIVASTTSDERKDAATNTPSNEPSSSKDKTADLDEATKQQMLQDFINDGKRTFDDGDDGDDSKVVKKRGKSKYAISLSGRSALMSSQQTSTLPATLRSSLSDSYGSFTMSKMQAYTDEKDVNPESETNHRQPLSFGLLTSFDITSRLQIETGLVYTFLSSETNNSSEGFNNTEKVQFHYLGIPVNVNYTILSVNKLDMFVTAGAMIEKDIYGKIEYRDEKTIPSLTNSGYANESSSKINQKNPQISVATGVGITYPIYNKAHLFGKIGGRYYINANNEFKTYYSDEKFGLDIQLGIKLNF